MCEIKCESSTSATAGLDSVPREVGPEPQRLNTSFALQVRDICDKDFRVALEPAANIAVLSNRVRAAVIPRAGGKHTARYSRELRDVSAPHEAPHLVGIQQDSHS